MLITINTDASWHKSGTAGFAIWMVSNMGRLTYSGVLRKNVDRPEVAEFKCIINALHILHSTAGWKPTSLIINTDCLNVIHLVSKNKGMIKKYRLNDWGRNLTKQFNDMLIKMRIPQSKVDMRHVPSHRGTNSKRTWVNEWCDQNAKAQMRDAVYKKPTS